MGGAGVGRGVVDSLVAFGQRWGQSLGALQYAVVVVVAIALPQNPHWRCRVVCAIVSDMVFELFST